ncbi:hypothetical protein N431DRAFT_474362 [Stipitochalara longipes BDJ]|nr:hypothetical protein N431DRAFT_474362 [Stipitochalara longipes BDJ]
MAEIALEAQIVDFHQGPGEKGYLEISRTKKTPLPQYRPLSMELNDLEPEPCRNTAQQCRRGRGYLICLTISAGGLQVVWATIMGQGSPFLSNLGIPAYIISFIWLAGPLSGALVQPYVSILSDRSCHSWGRRRPFILFGAIYTIIPMILLPWTSEIASLLTSDSSSAPYNKSNITFHSFLAGLLVWILNISIQPMQVGIRALVVDSCLPQQQVQATSYVSGITAVGSILGYTFGFLNLPRLFPWLGTTQYQCVFLIASLVLMVTVATTCCVIQEKPLILRSGEEDRSIGIVAIFRQVLVSARLMPKSMKSVCKIQFCSWLGWFPFLFYITTYLGEAHKREDSAQSLAGEDYNQQISQGPEFIRQGTMTMVIFAAISLASNMLLPLIITTNSTSSIATNKSTVASVVDAKLQLPFDDIKSSQWSITRFRIRIPRLSLPRAWAVSQLFASVILLTTIFTQSSLILTAQVSLLGISWAMTQWAPLALISTQMANYESAQNGITDYLNSATCHVDCNSCSRKAELSTFTCSAKRGIASKEDDPQIELRAGAVMGIYNVSIAAPQILAAIGSSCLFWILGRLGIDNGEAVGWVIGLGGLSNLAAAWFTLRIEWEQDRLDVAER